MVKFFQAFTLALAGSHLVSGRGLFKEPREAPIGGSGQYPGQIGGQGQYPGQVGGQNQYPGSGGYVGSSNECMYFLRN